ncbi:MAG: ATPase, T2SS/T4P/T4SS family, partial [Hydrogenobacter thermophilus]|nr:ATPase, T2SS/T4P/T4SS family [Hydrogenobacter thermophilus]
MDEAKLLELFVRLGYITREQAKQAYTEKEKDEDIITTLIRLGFLDDAKLADFYSRNMPQRFWKDSLEDVKIPDEVLKELPEKLLRKYYIAPVKYEDGKLTVVTVNPFNQSAINELRFKSKINTIIPYASTRKTVENILNKLYPTVAKFIEEMETEEELEIESLPIDLSPEALAAEAGEAPIVKLANYLIYEAVRLEASDIHIEPYEKKVIVRYRVDGILRIFHEFPLRVKDPLTARYKIMSNMDIAERRKPQDGRIRVRIGGKRIDLRVSTVPTVYGEKVVMRIQEAERYLSVKLEDLGFEEDDLEKFRKAIWTPWGMILVTGPTGSGKTTTLYASLMERNTPEVNIMTAEDPVEVSIPG